MTTRCVAASGLALFALAASAPDAAAQAWVPRAGQGAVTVTTQAIDHRGHIQNDGSFLPVGKSTTVGLELVVDRAFTDRWSISVGLPYVFAKYRGPDQGPPGIPFLPVDACFCFHSGVQDVSITSRYNLVHQRHGFALTPSLSVGLPTWNYDHVGEAVVGRHLTEARIAIDAGQRQLIFSRLTVEGQYSYAFVERVLGIPNNRSNGSFDGSVDVTRHLAARGVMTWQRTHGGLRFPGDVMGVPERIAEHDRLLRDNSLRLGVGLDYGRGPWGLSVTYIGYARGSNTHAFRAFTVSLGRTFETGRR